MIAHTYVQVMKMGVLLHIPIEESTDLKELQKKVADEYWKYAGQAFKIPRHGEARHVGIYTDEHVLIQTDRHFQEYKDFGKIFNARVSHPFKDKD